MLCVLLFAIVPGVFLFPRRAAAISPLELLEVKGILEGIDDTETPNVITLEVYGEKDGKKNGEKDREKDREKASGPLHEDCVFYDEKRNVLPREVFLQSYIQKPVTVEINEETGQVLSCRAGL
jgi:hypothetical protein